MPYSEEFLGLHLFISGDGKVKGIPIIDKNAKFS